MFAYVVSLMLTGGWHTPCAPKTSTLRHTGDDILPRPGLLAHHGSVLPLVMSCRPSWVWPRRRGWVGPAPAAAVRHVLRLEPWRVQVIRGGDLPGRLWYAPGKR